MASDRRFTLPVRTGFTENQQLRIPVSRNFEHIEAFINKALPIPFDEGGFLFQDFVLIQQDDGQPFLKLYANDTDDVWQWVVDDNDLLLQFFDSSVPSTTTRMEIVDDGNWNIHAADGTVVFQWDEASDTIEANDKLTGQQVIFPKGYLIDAGYDVDNSPSSWGTSSSSEHSVTVACAYANQPVYVHAIVRARFNTFPAGGQAMVEVGVAGATLTNRSPSRVDVADMSGSVSAHSTHSHQGAGDTLWLDNSDATHKQSAALRTSSDGPTSHSDSFAIDTASVTVIDEVHAQATANGSGNLVIDLFGSVGGAASSETPAWQEITYEVKGR